MGHILAYTISGGYIHQLASATAGGIYLLSPTEQAKRLKAGISDSAYAPVPCPNPDNGREGRIPHGKPTRHGGPQPHQH
eukprot:614224-Rhodomonas_salina.1